MIINYIALNVSFNYDIVEYTDKKKIACWSEWSLSQALMKTEKTFSE